MAAPGLVDGWNDSEIRGWMSRCADDDLVFLSNIIFMVFLKKCVKTFDCFDIPQFLTIPVCNVIIVFYC
jgi:hypothetical protein